MPETPLNHALGVLLIDAARLLRKRFEQKARAQGLGLTRAQYVALSRVARQEGLNQSALAELVEVEPITLARVIDRLEAAGLVERRPDPADRRARLLYVTEAAHPSIARMRALGEEVASEALAGVGEADRARLTETLLTIKTNLATRACGDTAGASAAAASRRSGHG